VRRGEETEKYYIYEIRWRNASREGGIWPSDAIYLAHLLFRKKSEAGRQLKMDDFSKEDMAIGSTTYLL
jgi:hypothetical protein